ncbi:MAG: hypothetical protein ACYC0V_13560 [Armatimonadota bacterium]
MPDEFDIPTHLQSSAAPSQPVEAQPYSQFNNAPPPKGLNWGAFLEPFFWSIAHNAWLWAVLSIFLHLVAVIVLLINGNEIAYQNRKFSTEAEFNAVQRSWLIWGLIIRGGITIAAIIIFLIIPIFHAAVAMPQTVKDAAVIQDMLFGSTEQCAGSIKTVQPFTGSRKVIDCTGSDNDGAYTLSHYALSADVPSVAKFFEEQFKGRAVYKTHSSGIFSKRKFTDIKVATIDGFAIVHIFTKKGETHYYIKMYDKSAYKIMPIFPKGLRITPNPGVSLRYPHFLLGMRMQ